MEQNDVLVILDVFLKSTAPTVETERVSSQILASKKIGSQSFW